MIKIQYEYDLKAKDADELDKEIDAAGWEREILNKGRDVRAPENLPCKG